MRRRLPPPLVSIAICTLIGLALAAVFAGVIAPLDPAYQNLRARNLPPAFLPGGQPEYLLGTDQIGRDVLSRILFALRSSLGLAAIGTTISLTLGVSLGLLAGMAGGPVGRFVMMLVDAQLALPTLLLAMGAVAVFGSSLPVLIAILGVLGWEGFARLTRGMVLSIREQPYVEASRAVGSGPVHIGVRHILPNLASPLLVVMTGNFAGLILTESTLSFLGLGVQPPTPSLGAMVGAGRDYMATAWWIVAVPGAFLFMITMSAALLGSTALAQAPETNTLRVGVTALPAGHDPARDLTNAAIQFHYNIFDTLILKDHTSEQPVYLPGLATDWHWAEDNVLEVTLREGVLFHDGSTLTASDVKFSLERVQPEPPYATAYDRLFSNLDHVEIVDDSTVRIVYTRPDPIAIDILTTSETSFRVQAMVSRIAHLTIIDALYTALAEEDPARSREHLELTNAIIEQKRNARTK